MTFTVIGLYRDGMTFTDHVDASDAYDAMQQVAAAARASEDDLEILGAIEGQHEMTDACDGGHCAHVDDITGADEDEDPKFAALVKADPHA